MILTSHSISPINKTIDYCLQPCKISNVLYTDGIDTTGLSLNNSENHNTSIVKEEFLLYQNERLKKPYLSLIISPEIDLNNTKLKEVVIDTLKEMKLDNHQVIAITHEEFRGNNEDKTPVKHVHILVNRVDYNEKTYNDSYIGLKGIKAISKVAVKHNLKDVYNTRDYNSKNVSKQNSEFHSKKNLLINELKNITNSIIYRKSTLSIDDIFQELKIEHSIDVQVTQFKNGRFGVVFNKDGHSIKASQVSRFLSVIPNEKGYKANKKLQPILDSHLIESKTNKPRKTEKEIKDSYLEHNDMGRLASELVELTAFLKSNQRKKIDEDDPEFLRNKKSRKKKQLGFKVQI